MTRKKLLKRFATATIAFLFLVIGSLIALPFFFKDDIIAAVKNLVNENLNAEVNFSGVDVSLFRNFPKVSMRIEDFSVLGKNEFEGVKLVTGKSFDMTLDFWSAWNFGKVPLEINSISLNQPDIQIIVLENGKANYDIALPSDDTTASAFAIQLQEYGINDGKLIYDDRELGMYVKGDAVNHKGRGDFTQDIFDLNTETNIREFTFGYGGLTYIKKAKTKAEVALVIDMPKMKFTLSRNEIAINDMVLKADGWLAMPTEDIDMDIAFNTPASEFKSLLSLIPNAYIKGYEDVKANGTFTANGFVKGTYSASPEKYPAFQINLEVSNGNVKYPDLPLGISNIFTKFKIDSPGSDFDKMIVDVSRFSMIIGSNPLEGWFKLKTPISDPDIDTKIKGKINLEELSRAYPMEGLTALDGVINADVALKTRMSAIDKGDYANVNASGSATIEKMNYKSADMPPVFINRLALDFNPQNVRLSGFDLKLGKSDVKGSGFIRNILAYFSPKATMQGSLSLQSSYFNANEWILEEETTTTATPDPVKENEMFNRFDFSFDAAIDRLEYDAYKVENFVAKGNITPAKMTVEQLSGKLGESDFLASGSLTNLWGYFFENQTLGGSLSLSSNKMNLNQFMTSESVPSSATSNVASGPIQVPANINLLLNAKAGKVVYDNLELDNVTGNLLIKEQTVSLENVKAQTLGGGISLSGAYNTQNLEKPKFDFAFDIQRFDFQKSFNTFNTFKLLAPIGKFVSGVFNTRFSMSSDLKPDLMPDISSINADGMLQTLSGTISGFKPLEEIGNKLNVEAFKKVSIKDSKNWFSVKDGTLELQEFDFSYQGIDMKVAGSHKLAGDMEYRILAKIPRDKIGKNPLGAAANSGLDFLSKEASRVGLNIAAGEFVNVLINIGGKIADPKLGFKVVGSDGKAAFKEEIAAKVESEVNKKVDSLKSLVQTKIEEEKQKLEDTLKTVVQQAKDEVTKKVEEAAKKAGEEVKNKVGEEAKKKLEEILPIKKKKNSGGSGN
jgi:hypothetical protein